MRLPTRTFPLLILALVTARTTASAQSDRPEPGHWSCHTEQGQGAIYTTPVWDGTALMPEVHNALSQFLLAKYGYKGRVFCGRAIVGGVTVAKLVDDNRRRDAQWKAQGEKVVETTFTFDPAKASLAFACLGFTRTRVGTQVADSIFLSRVIRIPGSSQRGLSTAWDSHLREMHGGSAVYPGAGCTMLPPDPAEHQAQIDMMPGAYNVKNPAIVRLEWTYTPKP